MLGKIALSPFELNEQKRKSENMIEKERRYDDKEEGTIALSPSQLCFFALKTLLLPPDRERTMHDVERKRSCNNVKEFKFEPNRTPCFCFILNNLNILSI